jgi:Fur family ferric uptake transcriptional regulator
MAAADADRLRSAGLLVTSARLATDPAGSPARSVGRLGQRRHHLVCRRCGAVADADRIAGPAPCLASGSHAGFSVDEAEVTFWGLCARCQQAPAQPPPG